MLLICIFFVADLHGYIKRSLRVNREVFNVIPIAKALKLPEELLPQIKEKWSDDDCQLEVILNWLKQTDVLEHFFSRGNPLESLKQGIFQRYFCMAAYEYAGKLDLNKCY